MAEYPSSRPSKRRKLLPEPADQQPEQTQPRVSRSSKRDERARGDDKREETIEENGVEAEPLTAHRRSGRKRNPNKDRLSAGNSVNGTSSPAPRARTSRPSKETETNDLTPEVEQRRSTRSVQKDETSRPSKPARRAAEPSSKAGEKVPKSKSKAARAPAGQKTVWDMPMEDDNADAEPMNGIQTHSDVDSLAEQEAPTGSNGTSSSDAMDPTAQLQQELTDTHDSGNTSHTIPSYAAKFAKQCKGKTFNNVTGAIGRLVLQKLCGQRRIPLKGLDSEYQTVFQLLQQTVAAGEGNSMLLLGPRGSGKTTIVETAIAELTKAHGDDFHVVRLNGFLHTDDKIALREIWRQLGREAGTDDDELNKISSYADTMATLLALLSHPEDFGLPEDEAGGVSTTKSVVIVLDEFDLFSYHPRQTLLYNLFDIAQAKKAPLAVLGLTTRVDVTENLEKRVKSRFSHRYVFLPRPKTLEQFSEICLAALRIEGSGHDSDTAAVLDSAEGKALVKEWNQYLQTLWEDRALQAFLQQLFYQTRCPTDFFTCALTPISAFALHPDPHHLPTAQSFTSQGSLLLCPDPAPFPFAIHNESSTSAATTSLPLSLLLTATRLTALHEPDSSSSATLPFTTVYAEYVRLLTSAKASASASGARATAGRIWGRDAAREAWEKLAQWGLVVPFGAGNASGDSRLYRVEISFEEVVEGLGEGAAGSLGRWWRET